MIGIVGGGLAAVKLVEGYREASWELSLARKDARLMIEAAAGGVPLVLIPALATRMDAVIAEGHGGDDWTVIAKDAVTR